MTIGPAPRIAVGTAGRLANALTVDVEDYFQVQAFAGVVRREAWGDFEPRVVDNTRRVLDLLDESGVRGTFFVLGWVAERFPDLVRDIRGRGHELGSHGYGHEPVFALGAEGFRDDVRRAKAIIEDISGAPVVGYRAPSFSITKASLWAFDILAEEGYRFDSSVFPIHHDFYGIPDAPRGPHAVRTPSGTVAEFPLSTVPRRLFGKELRFPVSGGGYLRFLPFTVVRRALERINTRDGWPAVLYFHPWEVDPGQPRIKTGLRSRVRHYTNLGSTLGKVRRLLAALPFAPMGEVLALQGLLPEGRA